MSFSRVCCSCLLSSIVLAAALQALAPAQSSSPSSPSSPSASKQTRKTASAAPSKLDSGVVMAGVYRNPTFGFMCKIPAGWVLRTEEMNAPEDDGASVEKTVSDASRTGRVLLAAFSRPPQARGEDVNASILIAAESAASYPGLKNAAQYFGPLTEVTKGQGFEVVEEPYEFVVGTKTVGTRTMVRGDFQRNVGTRVMRQSTLVMLVRGSVVSFTFIAGTEDELEELVEGLSFGAGAKK